MESANETPVVSEIILVVDDDTVLLEGIADLLRCHHYRVATAPDGITALTLMQQQPPDLVISDIMMPGMDGYQFHEAVRSNPAWAVIPFIFLSARSQPQDIRLGQGIGVDAYITKPFAPQDVVSAVQARLQRAKQIRAAGEAELNQVKQQLITVFGHELRTPLTYIYGYVHLLEEQDWADETTRQMIEGIRRGAERLHHVVEDLMLAARIDSGVADVEVAEHRLAVNLSPILQNAASRQEAYAQERNVEIATDLPLVLEAECVPSYVEEAVGRLVNNGVKFSKREGGRVIVRAMGDDQAVVISIQDDGIGIAPHQQRQLFERLHQIDRTHMEQQGLGLGLTIAQSLIWLHGGSIDVESAPGEGSTFTIRLPLNGSRGGERSNGSQAVTSGSSISMRAND
jgi:signal transduction histidine kinase